MASARVKISLRGRGDPVVDFTRLVQEQCPDAVRPPTAGGGGDEQSGHGGGPGAESATDVSGGPTTIGRDRLAPPSAAAAAPVKTNRFKELLSRIGRITRDEHTAGSLSARPRNPRSHRNNTFDYYDPFIDDGGGATDGASGGAASTKPGMVVSSGAGAEWRRGQVF